MHIRREDHSQVSLLTLMGDFDSFVLDVFREEVEGVHSDGLHTIILNMGQVGFMNSPAVGALIREAKRCREAGGDLLLSQPSNGVRMTIESLGLDNRLSIYDDDAAALEGIDNDAPVELTDAISSVVIVRAKGSRPLVCRLRQLGPDTMECDASHRPRGLAEGRSVGLFFRLPLYSHDRFEITARLGQIVTLPQGIRLSLRFTEVPEDAREAIERFCEDIRVLRAAAHEGRPDADELSGSASGS